MHCQQVIAPGKAALFSLSQKCHNKLLKASIEGMKG